MVVVLPRWLMIVVIAASLLATGCSALREHSPDMLAVLIDRTVPPAQVAGLDYTEIAAMGVYGTCDTLATLFAQQQSMPRRELEDELLPACEAEVQAALALQREDARLDELVEQAWQSLLARREQQRLLEQRRQLEAELQRRHMLKQQAQEQQRASQKSRQQELMIKQQNAVIQQALADLNVIDKPLAYSVGQVSERSLSNFLACIELAYPNKGYQVRRDGRKLVVIAEKAALPRGRLPIELRFTENDSYWLMTFLKVAEISASSAQDRFILAQNLVAQSCYGVDGLL
jgi:hypothetical protein